MFLIRPCRRYDSLSDGDVQRSFSRFKELADKKKQITNLDIESLVNDEIQFVSTDRYKLDQMQVGTLATKVAPSRDYAPACPL